MPVRAILVPLLLAAFALSARAQNPSSAPTDDSVTVNVLNDRVAIGEIGQIFIKVRGSDAAMPAKIEAQGLEVTASGSQSSIVISGGRQTMETTYFYRFQGDQPGTYTIPEFDIRLGDRTARTRPLVITVVENSGGDEALDATKPYFAKLELTRDRFYVNELVPFTLSAYVRGRNAINDVVSASLDNEGFVIKGFREVRTEGAELGNNYYSSAVIPSHLFALRAGDYRMGPAKVAVRVLDSDPGFGRLSSFFQRTVTREMATNTVNVVVKPLPEGAPASFTGGIGNFKIEATPSTTSLAVGDPVSIDFTVTGAGNLRTMGAPVFAIPQKGIWKAYDANKKLNDEEDSDGFKPGRVQFSQVIIPETRTETIPEFHLTYFDPAKEEYVTLKTAPIPITVQAATVSDAAVSDGASHPAATELPAAKSPEPVFADVMHIRTLPPRWVAAQSLAGPGTLFYLVQGLFSVALCTVLAFGLARWIAARKQRVTLSPVVEIPFSRAVKQVPATGAPRREFYHAVAEAVAAWRREHPDAPAGIVEHLARLSNRCDAVLFSGRGGLDTPVDASETEEITKLLKTLRKR